MTTLEHTRAVAAATVGALIQIASRLAEPAKNPEYRRALRDLITEAAGLDEGCRAEILAAIAESAELVARQNWMDDLHRQAAGAP